MHREAPNSEANSSSDGQLIYMCHSADFIVRHEDDFEGVTKTLSKELQVLRFQNNMSFKLFEEKMQHKIDAISHQIETQSKQIEEQNNQMN